MDLFSQRDGTTFCEDVALSELAEKFLTPLYVYSAGTVRDHYRKIVEAFEGAHPLVCYSVKANSNLALLSLLKEEGAGFDIVSGGELHRAITAGADPSRVVFAGVGKTDREISEALEAGILFFNVESEEELLQIESVAAGLGVKASVALRLNPDVSPDTHRFIVTGARETKFGLDVERAATTAKKALELDHIDVRGVHMHIGSQILEAGPYEVSLERTLAFAMDLAEQGHPVDTINVGGGFGITYDEKEALPPSAFAERIVPLVAEAGFRLILEPGRFIVGNAGVLLARVIYHKDNGFKRFAITDAGMNDLVRPSLYGAFHRIWPVDGPPPETTPESDLHETDVVGPICESGDFLAKARLLPEVKSGDLLAVYSAGAYGFTMASNYNSRPRPAEVLVDGDRARLIRRRETYADLVGPEMDLETPGAERD